MDIDGRQKNPKGLKVCGCTGLWTWISEIFCFSINWWNYYFNLVSLS